MLFYFSYLHILFFVDIVIYIVFFLFHNEFLFQIEITKQNATIKRILLNTHHKITFKMNFKIEQSKLKF